MGAFGSASNLKRAIGHLYPLRVFAPTILSSHRSPDRVRGLTAWSPSLELTPFYCPLIDRTGARPVPTKKDQNKRKRAIGHLYPLWVFEPTVLTNKSIKEKGYVTEADPKVDSAILSSHF